jgi:hypothetical protein
VPGVNPVIELTNDPTPDALVVFEFEVVGF